MMPQAVCFLLVLLFSSSAIGQTKTFLEKQKSFRRVRAAIKDKEPTLKARFAKAQLSYPPKRIFIRVFKHEEVLELWSADASGKMRKVFDYPICYASGKLGPKRKEGDEQVPEGIYYIDRFNPASNFFLSLGINYPNRSDRKFAHRQRPGGDIFLHGNCVSIGCVAITDPLIKELYLAAVQARSNGQRRIPVHIFPMRMDKSGLAKLKILSDHKTERWAFWKNLAQTYRAFEKNHRVPKVRVSSSGRYRIP